MNPFDEQVEAGIQKRLSDPVYLREKLAETLDINAQLIRDNERLVEAVQNRELELEALNPAKEFYEAATGSDKWLEMAAAVKVLAYKGYGRNKTFELLRDRRILRYNNEPRQEYVERGYFKTIEEVYEDSFGRTGIFIKTMVSQKGLDFIRKLIEEAAA